MQFLRQPMAMHQLTSVSLLFPDFLPKQSGNKVSIKWFWRDRVVLQLLAIGDR
jgi:hypothetical protein